jgi:DNA-binding NtrC family response regulator
MPEMTGVELLSRVQGTCPQAVRIVFTGYADIKAVIDAINLGHIYRYITKPWDPDELRAILHRACAHHDEVAERQRLLSDLCGYLDQCLRCLAGRQEQGNEPDLVGAGRQLRERLDRALQHKEHS